MNVLSRFAALRRRVFVGLTCLGLLTATFSHAQTLQKVKQSGELRIGVAAGDPWYYRDPVSGQWTGVGVLVGEQIAKNLGVKMVPVETGRKNWASPELVTGHHVSIGREAVEYSVRSGLLSRWFQCWRVLDGSKWLRRNGTNQFRRCM